MPLAPLPVDSVLGDLADALDRRGAAVLRAPTGSGKTTRVPPALLAARHRRAPDGERQVVVLEPRRLAARAAAQRIADERGWTLGGEVGYHVRLDRKASRRTRLLFVTEGILIQRLQADPFLEEVALVIFDEFHERSLQADLALGMLQRVRREVRDDLDVLLMSATLDPEAAARYLARSARLGESNGTDDPGDRDKPVPVIETGSRLHPVTVRYAAGSPTRGGPAGAPARGPREIARAAAAGVESLLPETAGDLLVFLPGVGEIARTEEELRPLAARAGIDLVRLHGSLPLGEQDAALRRSDPARGRRKVVLATNVAESSVTVEGIAAVVDTGLARRMVHDPGSGLNRLELARISRASADQRAGRAGREQPGVCLRLWPEVEHATLAAEDRPEVLRVELSGAVLELLAWGETDLAAFSWFDRPPDEVLSAARALLGRLGALDEHGLTSLGRAMARLPVHPRLARLLIAGHRRGRTGSAALAAAMLSERPPFRRLDGDGRGTDRGPVHATRSDLLDRLEVLEAFARTGREPWGHPLLERFRLRPAAARFVLAVRDRLVSLASTALAGEAIAAAGRKKPEAPDSDGAEGETALLEAIFAAHPDRLVRRRAPGGRQGVMVGGRGVVLAPESGVLHPELFVAVDLDAGRPGVHAEALVRLASGVERGWLPADRVTTETTVRFDGDRQRVVAARITRFEDLVLDEREVPVADDGAAAAVLAEAAEEDLDAALPLDDPAVAGFLARIRFLRHRHPELGLPAMDDGALRDLLPALAAGRRSFAELRRAPLLDVLRGTLSHRLLAALEHEAPERIEVPSGSKIRLRYDGEEPPVLAVRIQEMYGLGETPRVAGGRVPVLLHLLAPNMRPQQVTDDLAGFWERTYREIRKELAGRYPKHAWPDDPAHATPERRPRRRR